MKKIFYAFSFAFCLMSSFIGCKEKDMSMKMNNPRNIKDPWYTGNFDETFEDVVEGCKAFLESLEL